MTSSGRRNSEAYDPVSVAAKTIETVLSHGLSNTLLAKGLHGGGLVTFCNLEYTVHEISILILDGKVQAICERLY